MQKQILSAMLLFALFGCNSESGSYSSTAIGGYCEPQTFSWTDKETGTAQNCSVQLDKQPEGKFLTVQSTSANGIGKASLTCIKNAWQVDKQDCIDLPNGHKGFTFDLSINDGSRYYEYFSDTFAEVGKGWNDSTKEEGFFLIREYFYRNKYETVGGGYDMFPLNTRVPEKRLWANFLNVVYDAKNLTGFGEEQAPIAYLVGEINPFIPGEGSVLAKPYTTTIVVRSGSTVTLVDGAISKMNLDAEVTLYWDTSQYGGMFGLGESLSFSGDLKISEANEFTLKVGETDLNKALKGCEYASTPDAENCVLGKTSAAWDISGQLVKFNKGANNAK